MPKRKKMVKNMLGREWLMEQVGDLPVDFAEFCKKKMHHGIKFLFATRIAPKTYEVECQHCKQKSVMTNIKKGELTKCPVCKKPVKVRNTHDRCNGMLEDMAIYMENISDAGNNEGIMVRYFEIHYGYHYANFTCFSMTELQRAFVCSDGGVRYFQSRTDWEKRDSNGDYQKKWINGIYRTHYFYTLPECGLVYTKNIRSILKKYERYRFMPVARLCGKRYEDPAVVIERMRLRPQIEYLVKVGLSELADELIYSYSSLCEVVDYRQNELKKFLQLHRKEYYTFALRRNLRSRGIAALQWMEKNKIPPKPQYLKVVANANGNALDYIAEKVGFYTFFNYLKTQRKSPSEWGRFSLDYRDYICACVLLGYNVGDTMYSKPKNFEEMHDRATRLKAELSEELKNSMCEKMCRAAADLYNYKNAGLILRAPHNAAEIKEEGKAMRHCVGTYIERVAEERSVILFIRKEAEPDVPFVTLELDPKNLNVVQARAFKNGNPSPQVWSFIRLWQDKVLLPMILEKAS